MDWWKAKEGRDFAPADDPGVHSVRRIYSYYKTHRWGGGWINGWPAVCVFLGRGLGARVHPTARRPRRGFPRFSAVRLLLVAGRWFADGVEGWMERTCPATYMGVSVHVRERARVFPIKHATRARKHARAHTHTHTHTHYCHAVLVVGVGGEAPMRVATLSAVRPSPVAGRWLAGGVQGSMERTHPPT
jgi:hypothetical protein